MRDFHKLNVWEKSHALALAVYRATNSMPNDELFGLTSQIRRACFPANIAEGCGRSGPVELGRFLHISLGSASELEYHLLLARDLRYLPDEGYNSLVSQLVEEKQMLTGLLKTLKSDR